MKAVTWQVRMGRADVHRWSDDVLTLLRDDTDHLGVESFATHHLPRRFRDKEDRMVKVVFAP